MKKYIRSERANLFEPNVYISMVVKLSGNISENDIQCAVKEAYKANEATMSKIVLEDSGDAYYEKMDNSGCKFSSETKPWQELLKLSEKRPFALCDGELVRTFLTEEDGQRILFIHAHHLVGDGKSILVLLKDIVDCLAGRQLVYKPMTSVDRNFLEKKAKLMWGIKLAVKRINRKWKKAGRSFSWDDYYVVHNKYWAEHTSEIELQTYDVKKLKAQCENGVTLNSYMIGAMLRNHPEWKVVGIPVSIREENGGMSNQTSGIAIKYRYNQRLTFEENVVKLHKVIYRKIANENMKYFVLLYMERLCPSLIDGVLLQTHGCYENKLAETMARTMGYIGNGGRDFGVTNLNQIEIPDDTMNFNIESIIFVPPKVSYTKHVMGISTYHDVLTVSYSGIRREDMHSNHGGKKL